MIDENILTAEQKVFLTAVKDAGFPADDAAFNADLQTLANNANLPIANPSKYSAFWCFVKSALTDTAKMLIKTLVTQAMPGFYVKTAAGGQLDIIAWGFGVSRKPAAKATCEITFYRAAGATGIVEIPAGTRVRTMAINGTFYRMVTTVAATIVDDAQSCEVPAEAETAGKNYNLGMGYYSILDSDVPRLGAVTNLAGYLTTPGADAETDEELRLRIRDRFLAVGDWHTDAKYRAMIAERAGIRPDRIYFDHSAPRGAGSADCYIIFESGTTPADYLTLLNQYIAADGNHGHGDDLQCKAIPEHGYNLACTIRLVDGLTASQKTAVKSAVFNRIKCAFWDNNDYPDMTRAMPYSTFSWSRLSAELHAGVPELVSISYSLSNITVLLELPKLTGLTVTEA